MNLPNSSIVSFFEQKYGEPYFMENRTRLYGHTPRVAPKAYEAIIYPELNEDEIIEFSNRLGSSLPEQYHEFLLTMNGVSLHIGKVRLFGYIPIKRLFPVHPHYYPSNLVPVSKTLSTSERFCIGWIQEGNRNVYIHKKKIIVDEGKCVGESFDSIFDFVLDQYSAQDNW